MGAFWASTAPAASTASVVGRARALAQAITLAGHLHQNRMRQKAIENRRGRRDIAEEEAPILRRPIRRDERGRGFVATHEDLEEILGRTRAKLLHSEIFENEEVDAGELLDQIATRAGGIRFGEVGGEIERAAHECAPAGANRADSNGGRDVRFANAWWADQEHTAVRVDETCTGQFHDLRLRRSWD